MFMVLIMSFSYAGALYGPTSSEKMYFPISCAALREKSSTSICLSEIWRSRVEGAPDRGGLVRVARAAKKSESDRERWDRTAGEHGSEDLGEVGETSGDVRSAPWSRPPCAGTGSRPSRR